MSLRNLMESTSSQIQIKAESVAPATSYITNGFVFTWGALTFNQIMMLIGTILALATFFVNLYFQRKRDARERAREQREAELHRRSMQPHDQFNNTPPDRKDCD